MAETAVTSNLGWDNFFSTTTTGALTATTTTIPLATPPTPTEGFLVLDPGGANEIIFYNSVSGNNVIVPTTDDRGRGDSTAQAHSSGITVKMNTVGMMFEALQSGLGLSATFNLPAATVKNADLATSTGELGAAWQTWTPTLSGALNDSKWTKNCKYIQIGKTVFFKLELTANAATPMDGGGSDPAFSLPVTATTSTNNIVSNSTVILEDTGTAEYFGYLVEATSTTRVVRVVTASGTYAGKGTVSSTTPHTWANTDIITANGFYEAA